MDVESLIGKAPKWNQWQRGAQLKSIIKGGWSVLSRNVISPAGEMDVVRVLISG